MIHTGIIYGGEEGIYAGYMLQYQEDEIRRKYKYSKFQISLPPVFRTGNVRPLTKESLLLYVMIMSMKQNL
jgi:hypothetical protein